MTTAPAKKRLSPLAFAGIVCGVLVLACVFLRVSGLGLRLISNIGPPIEGQIAYIRVDTPSAIVARDMAIVEQVAAGASPETLLAMEGDGRIFLVGNGTRVKVLSAGARAYQIEIVEGEHAGKVGYTAASFVQH